jgi:predicted Zn-dependent protease
MKNAVSYTLLLLTLVIAFAGHAQVDQILKPVEIRPPAPAPPQNKETDEQIAAQYFRNRDFEKAVVLYKELYENKSNSIYYTYYLYCLLELEEFKGAEKLVKKQMQAYPDRIKYRVDLGHVYSKAGESSKAKKQFENVVKDLPADKNGIQTVANAFLYRGQTDYAVAAYDKGSKLLDYPFYMELGNLYRQTRNFSLMVEAYLDCVDYDYFTLTTVQSRLQSVLADDPDQEVSEYLRVALLKRIQKDPQKVYFSEMLRWLSIQNEDFDMALMQAKAIDRRLGEDGQRLIELAEIALMNKDYEVSIEAYKYILKKGSNNFLYLDAKIGLLYAHYLRTIETAVHNENDLQDLENEYLGTLEEFGRNASTIIIMQYLGHLQAFYLDKPDDAIVLLNEAISMASASDRSVAACKIELADVFLLTGDVWEAKLLYAQVEKAFKLDPLGYEAKYKNARLSFYIGEYDWAKAQLDVLKAATSKLIANDALRLSVLISDNIDADSSTVALGLYGKADLLLYRNREDEAITTLDSIFQLAAYHPIFDEVLLKKAEIRIRQQRYDEASELLGMILEKYPYDITADNALFTLAQLNEQQLHDPEKAKALYQQLLNDYPASLFAVEARKRFRVLRGDFDKEELTEEEKLLFNLESN